MGVVGTAVAGTGAGPGGGLPAASGALVGFEAPDGPAWLFLGIAAAVVLGPVVATRLRLPAIIGLLAGGLAIGPSGLGIVPSTDTILAALGQLGLLYLMFTAGAELDLPLFRRYRRAAGTFGLMTFSAPMALGFAAGQLLGYSTPASLLLGSLWASHTLVTYPMVREAGLAGDRAVATTVGATVITDTLSLIVLAGVAGSTRGDGSLVVLVGELLLGLALLGGYAGVVLPAVTRWAFTHVAHGRGERYALLLAGLLSSAVLAEVAGIEGIVGAFFAGLGLNRLVPAGGALMERVEFFGSAVLVPVFLVSVGVLIKPSVVADPGTLGLAAVFCAAVVGGKALAAAAARPVLAFDGAEAGLLFGLSLSQAAATLAATFVGFDVGLFGEQVVNAVLVVILVTLLVASLATARAIDRARAAAGEVERVGGEGSWEGEGVGGVRDGDGDGDGHTDEGDGDDRLGRLGRKVVLVVGREDRLSSQAGLARALAGPDGGVVVPVRVSVPGDGVDADRALLALAEGALTRAGLDAEAKLRVTDSGLSGVAYTVLEEGGSVVLLDWAAGSRAQSALRGERDDALLGRSPVPVLLAASSDTPHRRVVLALDRVDLVADSAADLALARVVADRLAAADVERLVVVPPACEPPPFAATAVEGDRASWVPEPGDVVVLPAHPVWAAFGPTAVRLSAQPGVSVVVAADPRRWSAGSALGALVGAAPSRRWS